jgi:UDP-N-acetylmuramate-alanine ligase
MPEIKIRRNVGEFCNKPHCQFYEPANDICAAFSTYLATVKATGNVIRCDQCKEAETK